MRTEAEIAKAIAQVHSGLEWEATNGPTRLLPMLLMCLDVLEWTAGQPGTIFERDVMEPCRAVDRAERQ